MNKPTEHDEIAVLVSDFAVARAAFLTHASLLLNRLDAGSGYDASRDANGPQSLVDVYTTANAHLRPMEKAFHRLIIAARKHDAMAAKSTKADTGSAAATEREKTKKAARKSARVADIRATQRAEQVTEPASDEPTDPDAP